MKTTQKDIHIITKIEARTCYKLLSPSNHPDGGGSKHIWNVSKFIWAYTLQHPRRQLPS
jgi:hypothetical protein